LPIRHLGLVHQDLERDAIEAGRSCKGRHALTIPDVVRCWSARILIACMVRVAASSASFSSSTSAPLALTVTLTVGANVPEPDIVPEDARPYPLWAAAVLRPIDGFSNSRSQPCWKPIAVYLPISANSRDGEWM